MLERCMIAATLCATAFCCSLLAGERFKITMDGKEIGATFAAVLREGKAFLNINAISKELGISVKMVGEDLIVLCVADRCVPVELNKKNGDVVVEGGETFVSTDVVASVLCCKSECDAKTMTLSLTTDEEATASSASAGGIRIGRPLPDFTLPDLSGKLVSLRDFRGKRVAVLMWASW